jgi:hypothetical protein
LAALRFAAARRFFAAARRFFAARSLAAFRA